MGTEEMTLLEEENSRLNDLVKSSSCTALEYEKKFKDAVEEQRKLEDQIGTSESPGPAILQAREDGKVMYMNSPEFRQRDKERGIALYKLLFKKFKKAVCCICPGAKDLKLKDVMNTKASSSSSSSSEANE